MPTTVTTSTSVVLVATSAGTPPYIVLLPNISTIGRLITVRDNDGFASFSNNILLSTTAGAIFSDGTSTIAINQPFGFITLNTNPNGVYYILNTFAFPAGQAAANVSNLTSSNITTRQIYFTDTGTPSTNVVFTSSSLLYLNSTVVGNITTAELNSTVNNLGSIGYLSSIASAVPSVWVAVGQPSSIVSGSRVGSIQYSTDSLQWLNASATGGFFQRGNSVAYADSLIVAVGNNDDGLGPNLGYNQWSIDGSNWNNSTSPAMSVTQTRLQVNYNNGLWHSVGSNPNGGPRCIQWSSDGKIWNDSVASVSGVFPAPLNASNGYATGIAYGNGVWVASGVCEGSPSQSILWSSDGSNWNNATAAPWVQASVAGVAFDGSRFVCLPSGGLNIASSTDGKSWSSAGITGGNLNNSAGQVSGNGSIWLITSGGGAPNQGKYLIYSTDALTWNSNTTFSACNDTTRLTDPYYDGAVWWVGLSNDSNAQAIYYSGNGISNWTTTNITSRFISSGFPNHFAVKPGQSNNNVLLVSSVQGIFQQISTSVTTNVLNANSINATTMSVATMTVSSLFINVTTVSTTNETINNISTLNADFLSVGITVGSTAFFSTLSSSYISTSQLWAGSGNFSTLNANTISSGSIGVSNINTRSIAASSIATSTLNVNTISSRFMTISTINMVGNVKISGALTRVAIGSNAGQTNQGDNAIAIGAGAGAANQGANTIVLNASGSALNGTQANALFINPIRTAATPDNTILFYSNGTSEITYGAPNFTTVNATNVTVSNTLIANNATISNTLGANTINVTGTLGATNVTVSNTLIANNATVSNTLGAININLSGTLTASNAVNIGGLLTASNGLSVTGSNGITCGKLTCTSAPTSTTPMNWTDLITSQGNFSAFGLMFCFGRCPTEDSYILFTKYYDTDIYPVVITSPASYDGGNINEFVIANNVCHSSFRAHSTRTNNTGGNCKMYWLAIGPTPAGGLP